MAQKTIPDAWVKIPTEEDIRQFIPAGSGFAYDFGFIPGMARLITAHGRIGALFGRLFSEIMFSAEGHLDRREREMVAAVTAAAQDCRY